MTTVMTWEMIFLLAIVISMAICIWLSGWMPNEEGDEDDKSARCSRA